LASGAGQVLAVPLLLAGGAVVITGVAIADVGGASLNAAAQK
jgi:hypothetical protein